MSADTAGGVSLLRSWEEGEIGGCKGLASRGQAVGSRQGRSFRHSGLEGRWATGGGGGAGHSWQRNTERMSTASSPPDAPPATAPESTTVRTLRKGTCNNNKNNSSSSGKAGKPRRKPHMPVVPVPSRPFTVDTQLQGRRSTSCLTHASPSSPHSPQPRFAQHAISRGRPHQMRASTAPTPEASAPLSPLGSPRKSSAVPPPSSSQRTLPVSHAGRRSGARFLPTPQEGARRNAYGPPRRPMTVQRGVAIPMRPPLSIVEDDEEEDKVDHSTTQRVMSLPAVVCRGADGEVYLVETSNVQNKRVRREFGRDGQKLGRDKLYNLMSSPAALATASWKDGFMDIGRISHEPTEDELHVEGEDGDWEAAHLNKALYREFRAAAPEYVESMTKAYMNENGGPRIDFEHWLLLRALEKEKEMEKLNTSARRVQLAAHLSWAPSRGRKLAAQEDDGTPDKGEKSRADHLRDTAISFGRSAGRHTKGGAGKATPMTSEAKRLQVERMTLPEIEFDFDGENITLQLPAKQAGKSAGGGQSSSGKGVVARAITHAHLRVDEDSAEDSGTEDGAAEGGNGGHDSQFDLGEPMTEDQLKAAAAAERQFRRLQRWEQQIFTKRSAKAPAQMQRSPTRKDSSKAGATVAKGGTSGRSVNMLMTKLRGQLGTRYRKQGVMHFQAKDPLSLVNGAMERQSRRENLSEEWARQRLLQRPGAVPVPTPAERLDADILKERPKTAARARASHTGEAGGRDEGAAATSEPFTMDEESRKRRQEELAEQLRQFEELEALVRDHDDFFFTGSRGKPSAWVQQLRKGYDAVVSSNTLAFDEFEARDAEEMYRKKAEAARMFELRFQSGPKNSKMAENFFFHLEELHAARPYFRPPAASQLRDKYERRPWSLADGGEQVFGKPAWSLEKSVFARRKQESDAKNFYDTPKLLERQVELDWTRVVAKKRFVKLIRMADHDIAVGSQSLNEELDEIHNVVQNNFMTIRSAFTYFCAKGSNIGEACFSMKINNWNTFCREVGIVDPLSATCNSGALNAMFLATNYEDGDAMSQREQEENNDNALMRFEWIEILVRVAIAKFIQDKRMTEDISTAMEYLCRYHLDTMPAEATLDVNVFRRTRFYSEEMDLLLRKYSDFLESVFRCYKAKNSSRYFWMEHWMTLLETLELVGDRTSIGTTQAKLVFLWSKTGYVDELRRRQRVVSWQFLDFLEGLARMAEAFSLPPPAELELLIEVQEKRGGKFTTSGHCRQWEYMKKVNLMVLRKHRRPSFGIIKSVGVSSTRPLTEKMEAFVGYMLGGLCEKWNVEVGNMEKLTSKLNAMAVMLGGGIELS